MSFPAPVPLGVVPTALTRCAVPAAWALGLALGFGSWMPRAVAQSTSPVPASVRPPSSSWVKTELYLSSRQASGVISPNAWNRFLAQVITPAFPKGLTVYEANGQIQLPNGEIRRSPTRVVVIVRLRQPDQDRRIEAVLQAYRRQFTGAGIMRLDVPVATPQFFAN